MRLQNVLKRAVSLALVVCLVSFGQVPPVRAQDPMNGLVSSDTKPLPLELKDLKIPSEHGRVEEVFQAPRRGPVIFLIQDAHAIPEAQENIRALLNFLQGTYGLSLTALEGVVSHLDPQIFRSYPDRNGLLEILKEISQKGELAGASAAAMLNEVEADYEGLEEQKAYDEGLVYFLEAAQARTVSEPALQKARQELEQNKALHYSQDLLHVDKALQDFEENHSSLLDVLRVLAAYRKPDPGTEVELVLENSARAAADTYDSAELKAFALKVKKFFESTLASPGQETLKRFNEHWQLYRTSQCSPQAFGLFLYELTAETPLQAQFPEKLKGGLWGEKRLKQLEGSRFFREFESYAAEVKESLFRNAQERELDRETSRLAHLRKWASLELGFEEWREISAHRDVYEKGFPEKAFQAAASFYENAEARDEIMFQKLLARLAVSRPSSAAVVAGGFHTEGLTRLLRKEETSYIVLTPEISSLPGDIAYTRQMNGEVSWGRYFRVEDGEVKLYDAFVRSLRDRLLEEIQNRPGADKDEAALLTKRWRDQILRDLASRGRIEEAGDYTRFLDELSGQDGGQLDSALKKVDRFIDQLRRLNQSGSLTEQNLAQILKPSARPVDAVQGALEPGSRLGGELIRVSLTAGGIRLETGNFTQPDLVTSSNDFRSELRSDEGEDAYRFIASPPDYGRTPGFTSRSYAAHVKKASLDFHFKKTKAYAFEDIGRFQISSLTFRLQRFPEALQAERESSLAAGTPAVGAASPKYRLEVYLANEQGEGHWRSLDDVEITDGQPFFIYRTSTKHISLPGLFDLFMNRGEQNDAAAELEEFGEVQSSRVAIVISWKDENGLVRNYYLPEMVDPERPETLSSAMAISRSAADDPDAESRVTIDADAADLAGAPEGVKGWIKYMMQGFVRPGHLMLMTDVQDGQDFVIFQNQGSMNGFQVEERTVSASRKKPAQAPKPAGGRLEEQSQADDDWGSQVMSRVPQEHSLVLQPRNFVEGKEGRLQFFYDGPFQIEYGAPNPISFQVTEGKLFSDASGVSLRQNTLRVERGDVVFEVFYRNGKITVTNYTDDEAAAIWVLKGGARSELREEGAEGENLPARPQANDGGLVPLTPEVPQKPSGLLARIGAVIQRGVDGVNVNRSLRRLKTDPQAAQSGWLVQESAKGMQQTFALLDSVLSPDYYNSLGPQARANVAAMLLADDLPEGYELYVRLRLGSLRAEDVAAAFRIGRGSEEIVPNLLRYNTPESNGLIRELLKNDSSAVRQIVFENLVAGAISHTGQAAQILKEARFLGEGLRVGEAIEKFKSSEDEGYYAFVDKASLVDLRDIANLPFEVQLFDQGEDRLVILKGGVSRVSVMFPGKSITADNLHNHPSKNIFPTGYQRRDYGYGSEEYGGDLMTVGTSGFHLIVSRHGITRYYRETDDSVKGVPGRLKIRFSDKSEIDFAAEKRFEGGQVGGGLFAEAPEEKYFFNPESPLLKDDQGLIRDFRATGMLGPSGQIFGVQFISWKSLAGSFLDGTKKAAFERFIPASFLDAASLGPGQSAGFEEHFKGLISVGDRERARLRAREKGLGVPAPGEGETVLETAGRASTELVPYRTEGFQTGLAARIEDVLPSLDQIEIQLQSLLASDYEAAIAFADRYLAPSQPPEVKQAVLKGLAHGAERLKPADANRYMRLGLLDPDNRVNDSALNLLAEAPKTADVFGMLQLAFTRHIHVGRLVRMTGSLQITEEQKTAMFLLYTQNSATYRNVLSESFSRNLSFYAPQDLFIALVRANLPSAMNETILVNAYQNLSQFEMEGLEGSGTKHIRLIPRLNLDDDALQRISDLVLGLGRPRAAQLYVNQIKKPAQEGTGGGAASLSKQESRSEFLQGLERLEGEARKARLLEWTDEWRSRYAKLGKKNYRESYALEKQVEDVLAGLSLWGFGPAFNRDVLNKLIPGLPAPGGSTVYLASAIGGLLGNIPLSSEDVVKFYEQLIGLGMEFFVRAPRSGVPTPVLAVAHSASLNAAGKKALFRAAFSNPEMASDADRGEIIENEIRRPYYQREKNLEWALEALLAAGLSAQEDMELIALMPMFRGDTHRAALQALVNLGVRPADDFNFMEALKLRHPEYMVLMKRYLAEKMRETLRKAELESGAGRPAPPLLMLEAEGSSGEPRESPESRSELRTEPRGEIGAAAVNELLPEVAHALAEGFLSDGFGTVQLSDLAPKAIFVVQELGVDDLAAEVRSDVIRTAREKNEKTFTGLSAKIDSRLAAFSIQWFSDALSVLGDEKLGAAFDVPGEEVALGRVLDENPSLKSRFESLLISKSMDLRLLKTEGIHVEVLRDPASYRAHYSLSNGKSLPVISTPKNALRLQNNEDAFAAVLTGEAGTDDGFESAALAAMLTGALLTSHFAPSAEKLKKSPSDRSEILRKVWAALLKSGDYEGPSFLEMGEEGVLSINRGNLQRFITEFLARRAVEAAA